MPQEYSYWVNNAERRQVSGSHGEAVVAEPAAFGLSEQEVKDVYAEHGDDAGGRQKAELKLVRRAAENGWVRVRRYEYPAAYLSIVADNVEQRAESIRSFLADALAEGLAAKGETVVIASVATEKTITYDSNDGGAEALLRDLFDTEPTDAPEA